MKTKATYRKFKHLLALSIFVALFFPPTSNSFADDSDRVRHAWIGNNGGSELDYSDDGRCYTSALQFVDLPHFTLGDDVIWELDNPVCLAYGTSVGIASVASDVAQTYACKALDPAKQAFIGPETEEIAAEKAAGRFITLKKFKRKLTAIKDCATNIASCAGSAGTSANSCTIATLCCSGVAADTATLTVAVSTLAFIWEVAKDTQRNAHICGETWNTWQQRDAKQNDPTDIAGIPDYQDGTLDGNKIYIYGRNNNSHQKKLQEKVSSGTLTPEIKNQEYREFIYGGMEFTDNGSGSCQNPSAWSGDVRDKILGYRDDNQRYYMRGPNETSNYACERFLLHRGTKTEKDSAKAAYDCCTQRSQNTICIEEGGSHKFCELGGPRCKIQHVWYDIYQGKKVANTICAKTYSVCPYNHPLGGGTEIEDLDPKYKILKNHCQYLKHCAKIPPIPYIRTTNLEGGWLSSACFDIKGDSQNTYGYTADLLPLNTKHFSAPMAQCFKETLENMLISKAGHTLCTDPDEQPDKNDVCKSGNYTYKAGTEITGTKSFFQTVQDNLRFAIKLVMTMAITIMGITLLLTGKVWDKKTIIMFTVKLALVSYFALGTAWQDYFFKGVTTASTSLAGVFMKIDEGVDDANRDGCQFPRRNYAFSYDNTKSDVQNYDLEYGNPSYPPGKEYLKIWDMLDCKIARAIGFGPEASIPNLIYLILAGFFTGGYGIIFFVATFIFAFYLIALTVRALHIFLISSMAITIMVYVSPITITAWLFEKTKSIFTQWRTNLVGFILQPVILFAYLGLLITIFEKTMIGSATFSGDGKNAPKSINCSVNPNGNPNNDSIYCIFRLNNIKSNNSLSAIGIAFPVMTDMNADKMNTIFKAAFLMFIFTKFLDQITTLSSKLVGGSSMSSGAPGTASLGGKALGYAKAVQSRGTNATRKWGGRAAGKAAGKAGQVKDFVRRLGAKGDGIGGSGSTGGGDKSPPSSSKTL